MTEMPLNEWTEFDKSAIREQLARILCSAPFLKSCRQQRFLEYIVNEALAGRSMRLKGYAIGLEVFDRADTFDPTIDPIVRVQGARLRDKLRDYYRNGGARDAIRIDVPKGAYVPEIIFRVPSSLCRAAIAPSENSILGHEGTRSIEAHDELLRGLGDFWRYSRGSCTDAQQHFSCASKLDPDYAAAHSWLARTYIFQYAMNWGPDAALTMDPAIHHAQLAVALDNQSPFAQAILGWVLLLSKDGEKALSAGRRACALDPNNADARLFLSLTLAATGQGREALRYAEASMMLQPHPSSFNLYALGKSYFALGDFKRAIASFWRGIEMKPSFMPNHYDLAIAYGLSGDSDKAKTEAAIVQSDWSNVSKDFYLDGSLAAEYLRGKKTAGLT